MLEVFIRIAGVAQIVLAAASLIIPWLLKWKDDLSKLPSLTRQVFWTYAAYIWFTNLSFGFLSATVPAALLGGSVLAAAVSGFIAVYWGARVVIQFVYFDRSMVHSGWFFKLAEIVLVALFLLLTLIYSTAFIHNIWGSPR